MPRIFARNGLPFTRLDRRHLPKRSLCETKTLSSSRSFWTVSFSGAGHLLPYHLGVAKTLLSNHTEELQSEKSREDSAVAGLPIRSVSGSSSGAIAATVMTVLPHRLEEYTDRFLQDRGHAFRNLRQMLKDETQDCASDRLQSPSNSLLLSICTTRCSDGGIELFTFDGHLQTNGDTSTPKSNERLLKAIEASCKIPRSFHPFDMVALNYKGALQMNKGTYPDQEGTEIDGKSYVDGGIAAPFPPTPLDGNTDCTGRIVVSPIVGEYFYKQSDDEKSLPLLKAIKPAADASWKVPLFSSVSIFGSAGQEEQTVPLVAVRANSSIQNLRIFTTAMGVVPASPNDSPSGGSGILRDWYERGQEDAHEMLNEL